MSKSIQDLRWLADVYMQAQEMRKGMKNRERARLQEVDEEISDEEHATFAGKLGERFNDIEKDIFSEMKSLAKQVPVYTEFLQKVQGIGPTYTTKLLAWIDIEEANTASSLIKYCGLAVEKYCPECGVFEPRKPMKKADMDDEDYEKILKEFQKENTKWSLINMNSKCHECGKGEIKGRAHRRIKGHPLGYNPKLKSLLWNIAVNFLKNSSPYRGIYDKEKAKKEEQGWGKSDGHRHNHALRKMEKIFLSHLWVKWRELEGLSTRDPWVIEHTEHNNYYAPEEFMNN